MFWESKSKPTYQFTFDTNKEEDGEEERGYLIKRQEIRIFLERILKVKQLNALERDNMITYWLKGLEAKENVIIQFCKQRKYEKIAKFEIKLDETEEKNKINIDVLRIFMKFMSVSNEESSKKLKKFKGLKIEMNWKEKIKEIEELERFDVEKKEGMKNLLIIEWGGMNLTPKSF